MDSLISKVDVSLTLTLSKQIAESLQEQLGWHLAISGAVATAAITAYVLSITGGETPVHSVMSLIRRFLAIVVARLMMKSAAMPESRAVVQGGAASETHAWDFLWATWPTAQALVVASILLIAVAFLSKQVNRLGGEAPEVERLLSSVQWVFADAMGLLVMDTHIRRYAAIVGIALLPRLISWSAARMDSPEGVWLQAIAMSWINVVVALFVPDNVATHAAGVDIVAVWVMACTLQALGDATLPGLGSLQGRLCTTRNRGTSR